MFVVFQGVIMLWVLAQRFMSTVYGLVSWIPVAAALQSCAISSVNLLSHDGTFMGKRPRTE